MKITRLVAAGLAFVTLGLSAGASAQGWGSGGRPSAYPSAPGRDLGGPQSRVDDRRDDARFQDQRFRDQRLQGQRLDDRRFDDRRFQGQRFDDRRFQRQRFDDRGYDGRDARGYGRGYGRGRDFDRDRRWGRDGGRGGRNCWIEQRRGGRVTVCR